jgi:hypothetical protein
VIAFGCLGQKCFVIRQLFLVGEGDAVDALQGVVLGIPQKVGCRVLPTRRSGPTRITHVSTDLGDHERLDLAGMRNMRSETQIDHWPATVHGGRGPVGNLGLDEVFLILVVLARPDRSVVARKASAVDVR